MKRLWLLTLIAVTGVAGVSWAMAQDTVGVDTQSLPGQQSSISVGAYGEGLMVEASPGQVPTVQALTVEVLEPPLARRRRLAPFRWAAPRLVRQE